jgi:hypothetical protein
VLKAITQIEFATRDAPDFVLSEQAPDVMLFLESISHDPIATVQALVHVVCLMIT